MPKKVKTPLQVAIEAIEKRHDELFNSVLHLYNPAELLTPEQRTQALEHKAKLAGLNEAVHVLRKLDTAE